jgi:high-affinity Fe2+/Pb2+ permease
MPLLGSILIILVLAIVLFLAVIAVIRGYRGMKISKQFDVSAKKTRFGYWLLSAVHMWVGILITLCYLIAGILILNKL